MHPHGVLGGVPRHSVSSAPSVPAGGAAAGPVCTAEAGAGFRLPKCRGGTVAAELRGSPRHGEWGGGAAAVGEAESPRGPPAAFPELRCARTRLASFFPPPPRSLAAFAMIHICSRQQTVT